MRRNLFIFIAIVLVLAVIIALSAAGNLELDRPPENELMPIRSSYNAGSTGTRAFYQLLEEAGQPTTRWRESFKKLSSEAPSGLLIIVGPFPTEIDTVRAEQMLSTDEAQALQQWIAHGGHALIVSRFPQAQFGDPMLQAEITTKNPPWTAPPEALVDNRSDDLIVQPTVLTKNLRGLAVSVLAARLKFELPVTDEEEAEEPSTDEQPTPSPTTTATPVPSPSVDIDSSEADTITGVEILPPLYAPVIHLGDDKGAVLADFQYGKGRLMFLSDPFVIANNGLARGANLQLALNLVRALSGDGRRIFFDEFHHGYRSESNPLVKYVRGTPVPWLLLQGLLLSLLMVYSLGKRFARPLPLPQVDRHSPLEFVASMANLQQTARARALALENIYPRFKAQLCRRLGLSARASVEEITSQLQRRRLPVPESELRQTLNAAELVLAGGQIDDTALVNLVAQMRRLLARLH
jgi:hypothetical protein